MLDSIVKKISKEKQPFERLEMKKSDLLEMFKYNQFKLRILNERVKTETTTVYKCGSLIDLCRGPHVRHTGKVKAMEITKNSSTYWEGKADAETLQRIYGISFPDNKQLKEWRQFQEEAAKRDHRKLGREQDLFFFHELSPGSCFFQPKGALIYNKLVQFIREEYWKRGFQEVISPNIYNAKLWQTSGHWDHYAENMFKIDVEKEQFGLKPMNCPGHCLIFDHGIRSWRDLPLRMADFGVLHRNELSGALTGLTRVRRFQQDDAHIFCMPEQIKDEMRGALDFLQHIYSTFGFSYQLKLSTRPESFLGDVEVWNQAEKMISDSLDESGLPWKLNPGDGAFYGPKIDITLMDALRRQHQCATIQLDFQLPIRFNLSYIDEKGEKKHPVIIHRAILGSVERMVAVLLESFGGKWPFWLSPRQAMVVPVAAPFNEYAQTVQKQLKEAGFMCEANVDNTETMNKKVRNAQIAQFNFIFGKYQQNCCFIQLTVISLLKFQWLARKNRRTEPLMFAQGIIRSMVKGHLNKLRKFSANWRKSVFSIGKSSVLNKSHQSINLFVTCVFREIFKKCSICTHIIPMLHFNSMKSIQRPVYKEFKWCIGPQATLVILEIQVINVADAADVYLCGGGVGR